MMTVVLDRVRLCASVTDHLTGIGNVTETRTVTATEVTEIASGTVIGSARGTVNATTTGRLAATEAAVEVGEEQGAAGVVADGQTVITATPIAIATPMETAQIGRWRNAWDYEWTRMANRGVHHGRTPCCVVHTGTTFSLGLDCECIHKV